MIPRGGMRSHKKLLSVSHPERVNESRFVTASGQSKDPAPEFLRSGLTAQISLRRVASEESRHETIADFHPHL